MKPHDLVTWLTPHDRYGQAYHPTVRVVRFKDAGNDHRVVIVARLADGSGARRITVRRDRLLGGD